MSPQPNLPAQRRKDLITSTKISKKIAIIAWCFYDWANSSFSAVITTFIFATYFTQAVAKNKIIGTAQWGNTIAIAGLIVAICSPFFGAIADHEGRRKPWLAVFTLITIVSSAALWFAKPQVNYVLVTLFFVALGIIGLEIGMVFYNAMLRDLAPKGYLGRISGWAWGLGYVGGLLCLIIALFLFVQGDASWLRLDPTHAEQIRVCGPLVAVWMSIFSLPIFIFTPDRSTFGVPIAVAVKRGLMTLQQTFIKLKKYREIFKFLLAQMLYIDGLNTLFAFGGIYAAGTFGLSVAQVIKFGITMNISAGVGAAMFAWMDDYWGAKNTVLISLIFLSVFTSILLLINNEVLFWCFALLLGLFVGPVQAASRSLMVRLAPAELITEMFGLYAFSGKATSFVGPWLLALLTEKFASQRMGMITIVIFLSVGAFLLWRVQSPTS